VEDVSYYLGNSCDNMGDSLRTGCNNNKCPRLVALVTADAEEDDDSWSVRIEELGGQSTGLSYSGKDTGSTATRASGY
jgi:hypothetical protein